MGGVRTLRRGIRLFAGRGCRTSAVPFRRLAEASSTGPRKGLFLGIAPLGRPESRKIRRARKAPASRPACSVRRWYPDDRSAERRRRSASGARASRGGGGHVDSRPPKRRSRSAAGRAPEERGRARMPTAVMPRVKELGPQGVAERFSRGPPPLAPRGRLSRSSGTPPRS